MKAFFSEPHFLHYKCIGKFFCHSRVSKRIVHSSQKLNSSEILCLSLLPASLMKIRSKLKALAWRDGYSQNFHHSRASDSEVSSLIPPEIKLVRDFMPVLVTSKFDEDPIKMKSASLETPFSHYKYMGNFLDAQGTWLRREWSDLAKIWTCLSFILCLSMLLASLMKIESKLKV